MIEMYKNTIVIVDDKDHANLIKIDKKGKHFEIKVQDNKSLAYCRLTRQEAVEIIKFLVEHLS